MTLGEPTGRENPTAELRSMWIMVLLCLQVGLRDGLGEYFCWSFFVIGTFSFLFVLIWFIRNCL